MKVTTALSFGDIALRKGYVSKEALQEALLLHAVAMKRRQNVSLGQVMLQAGLLSPEQVREIEREQQELLESAAREDLPEEVRTAMQFPANRIGKFVKLELVGRGGLGEVWRAYDLVIGRTVAIKFLLSTTPENWQRFVKEAHILGKLQHPNIVPLYELGDRFIVMPFIRGRTLDQLTLPVRQAADAIRQAALAIAYAHAQGVVHRDLKPSNIMIQGSSVFVTDFGISKELQVKESLTTTGDILGTPAYMSPEQIRARTREIDARTDIYALGATLYHLLTGRPAFANEDLYEMMRAIQEDDPVPPSRLNPQVPRDLEAIVLKAMEKQPARRYRTASAMAEDLERFLRGDPVLARPTGPAGRLVRRLARHKATVALAVVAAAGVAFGAVGFLSPTLRGRPNQTSRIDDVPSQTFDKQSVQVQQQREENPRDFANRAVEEANRYYALGEIDKMLDAANRAVQADPDNPSAYNARGLAHWAKGNYDDARQDFQKCSSYGPEYRKLVEKYMHPMTFEQAQKAIRSKLAQNEATQRLLNNDADAAVEAATRAIEADPDNPGGYFLRGRALWMKGDREAARKDFEKYASYGPEYLKLVQAYLSPTRK